MSYITTTPPTSDTTVHWAVDNPTDSGTGQPAIAIPSGSRIRNGFGAKMYAPRQFFNYLFNTLYSWIDWARLALEEIDTGVTTDIGTLSSDLSTAVTGIDGRLDVLEEQSSFATITVPAYLSNGSSLSSFHYDVQIKVQKVNRMCFVHIPSFRMQNQSGASYTGKLIIALSEVPAFATYLSMSTMAEICPCSTAVSDIVIATSSGTILSDRLYWKNSNVVFATVTKSFVGAVKDGNGELSDHNYTLADGHELRTNELYLSYMSAS